MSNIKINDVFQRIQYAATNGQTQFTIPFPFFDNAYVTVWQDGVVIDQGAGAGEYGITGAGSPSGGLITLVTPAALDSIITIEGIMPIDRTSIYSATISNLTGSDLNGDFNREVVMMKQIQTTQSLLQLQYAPWALISQDASVTNDRYLPLLTANQIWAKNDANDEIIAYDVPASGGLAPKLGTYLVQTATSELPNAQAMGALASGLVVNTTTTGVQLSRLLAGVTNQTVITNASGIAGNPTVGLAQNPILPGTSYFIPPIGTTAQRPGSPTDGMVRYNTDDHALEVYENSFWDPLSGGVVDLVSGFNNQITVDNTDQANPIVHIANNPVIPGTGGITLPTGTTAQRGGILGTIRFNSQTLEFEGTTDGSTWHTFQTSAGTVLSVSGTANEIDSTGGANPVLSFSATANFPGTFNIQNTTAINAIINDSTMATAAATNISTSSAIKDFVLSSVGTAVQSVSGTANQLDSSGGLNPVLSLSSTVNFPGTFNIQSSTAVNAIINDSTMATASATNLSTSAAIKAYVDTVAQGITVQGACTCASTTALTVTYLNGVAGVGATLTNAGAQAAIQLDGISPTVGQRVLIKNQASTFQNGIYTVTTVGTGATNWVLTRATDYDQAAEIQPGDLVIIDSGTTQALSSWLQTATVVTIGTDAITFSQFTAALPVAVSSGGTGKSSMTAYALIAGGTTTTGALQQLGLGLTGQILQSQGSSALAVFSTATYPSVATTSGTVLRADGTNWVKSTATFADTYLINQLLYASAANTIAGLATANNGILVTSAGGVPSIGNTVGAGLTMPSITFNSTSGIIGTTTNDSAASGSVGQLFSSVITNGSPVTFTSNTFKDLTTLTLDAGDYDIWGNIYFKGTTVTLMNMGIGTTTATLPDDSLNTFIAPASSAGGGSVTPMYRVSISGSTTYYLVGLVVGTGTLTGRGGIYARRRR